MRIKLLTISAVIGIGVMTAAPERVIANKEMPGFENPVNLTMPVRKAPAAPECVVTVTVPCGNEYSPYRNAPLRIYNETIQQTFDLTFQGNGVYSSSVALPAGKYDFMFLANHNDPTNAKGFDHNAIVVREGVEVDNNMQLTLNPATAVNHIRFSSFNRDGQPTEQSVGRFVDDSNGLEIVREGNVNMINLIVMIQHSEYNMLDYTSVASSMIIEPSQSYNLYNSGVAYYDFYVNDVSDKYEFRQVRQLALNDGSYDIVILSQNGASQPLVEVVNDPSDYTDISMKIARTPLNEKYPVPEDSDPYVFYIGATLLGGEIPSLLGGVTSGNPNALNAWLSAGKSTLENPLGVAYWTVWEYDDDYKRMGTVTPYMYLASEGNSAYAFFPQDKYAYGDSFRYYGQYYPGHPALQIKASDAGMPFQEAAPFALMSYEEMYMGSYSNNYMMYEVAHFGQMGERRSADAVMTDKYLYYEGEEVLSGMGLDYEWPSFWATTNHDPGLYELKVVNHNVCIDGIDGESVAVMSMHTGKEDSTPPAFQAIQTRNKNGELSIRFNESSDGEILLVGGDVVPVKYYFDPTSDFYSTWFDMEAASLKVEYAPNGTDDFREIAARSNDMDYAYWGFNEFFRVPLDEVSEYSSNKWYDLRLTLTDAAGNYQSQLLRPAFRVENMQAGIQAMKSSGISATVDGGVISVNGVDNAQIELIDVFGKSAAVATGTAVAVDGLSGFYIVRVTSDKGIFTQKIIL